jgi:hypothetical protein
MRGYEKVFAYQNCDPRYLTGDIERPDLSDKKEP